MLLSSFRLFPNIKVFVTIVINRERLRRGVTKDNFCRRYILPFLMTERAFLKFTIELAASVAKVICAATTFLLSPNLLHTSDTFLPSARNTPTLFLADFFSTFQTKEISNFYVIDKRTFFSRNF